MAPSTKPQDGRRKSGGKPTLIVSLAIEPSKLREILPVEDLPAQDSEDINDVKQSPESPASQPTQPAPPTNASGENASDSNAATPQAEGTQAEGTPAHGSMGPPADGPKKKGVKRSAANANGTADGVPKQRGKPGPKKKPRL